MQIVGADPDDLERMAGRISAAGRQLSLLERRMTSQLYATNWQGGDADAFKSAWNARHRRDIAAAIVWLDEADAALRRNADQQRRASEADGGGGRGSKSPELAVPTPKESGGPLSDEDLERLRELLDKLGIPVGELGKWTGLIELLAKTPAFNLDQLFGPLEQLSSFQWLSDAAGKASKALDIAGYALDYIEALGAHAGLPFDEMVVAASVTVGVAFAVDAGVDAASKFLGTAVASAAVAGTVTAPVAPLLGWLTSKFAGVALGTAVDFVDDQLGGTDAAVDASLDIYRYAKEHDFNVVAMGVDAVGDAAEAVWDAGTDLVGDGLDTMKDAAGAVMGLFS